VMLVAAALALLSAVCAALTIGAPRRDSAVAARHIPE
jgi:hypothetical protein